MRRPLLVSIGIVITLVATAASGQEPAPAPLPPPSPWAPPAPCTVTPADPCEPTAPPPSLSQATAQPGQAEAPVRTSKDKLVDAKLLHGFRVGYGYMMRTAEPLEGLDGQSIKERTGLRSPHHFLLGYEALYRMVGHSWLNVILVGNVLLSGIEQSRVYPVGNALIGFEFNNSFQVGAGASFTPLKGQEAHTIFAAGWTPRVGSFYVPVHAFFVPDVDGAHRMGVTTGVTF